MTEVLDSLTGVLSTTKEHGVGTLGGNKCELIEGHALSTRAGNSLAGLVGELEGSNFKGRKLQGTGIVGDGTDNNSDLTDLVVTLHETRQSRDGKRRCVDSRHSQALDNGTSELGISTTGNETIVERGIISEVGLRKE